jgi:hypothetical protein
MRKKWQGKPKAKTSPFYKICGYIVAVVGLAASIVTFLPRMTVESDAKIDPSKPYPMPFTITNTGVVPLMSVQPAMGLCQISTEPGPLLDNCKGSLVSRLAKTEWFVNELAKDEKHIIRLDDLTT